MVCMLPIGEKSAIDRHLDWGVLKLQAYSVQAYKAIIRRWSVL